MDAAWVLPWGLALIGACIGSFLNVVIYRIPRGLSVNKPRRSFCPSCGAPIPWYLNLPIISWVCLRGKSACCGQPISPRYVLVELACALLFGFTAWELDFESIPVQVLTCLWMACTLGMLVMDARDMIVHPPLAVIGTLLGFCVAICSPQLVEPAALSPLQGITYSFGGILTGFFLFRFIELAGRLAFGRRRITFASPQEWQLRQEGEDLLFTVGEHRFLWSQIFTGEHCSLSLGGATLTQCPGQPACLQFTEDSILLPDGTKRSLEEFDSLSGTCCSLSQKRDAMGSGDAWIAMSLGALCGWEGVLFSLVVGSFIAIFLAIIFRVRRGVPMPFGPSLILAAWVWFFFGQQLLTCYLDLIH